MTKTEFITSYVTTFLATYAARHYGDCSLIGDFTSIQGGMAGEALALAEDSWKNLEVQKALYGPEPCEREE